jgi:hypothetical protein
VKIPNLGIDQYFADEIDWVLDLAVGIRLPSSDDDCRTNHVACGRYVKLQVFLGFQGHQSGWSFQILLQVFEGLLCLINTLELVLFFEEFEETKLSHPVFKPKPNAHSMCAQESSLHTYHTENGDRITNVSI